MDGFKLLPSQIQSANPMLVMLLIPFANKLLFPAAARLGLPLTPLRRMTAGILLASLATAVIALIQARDRSPWAGNRLDPLAARGLPVAHDG